MERIIKFRAWDGNKMQEPFTLIDAIGEFFPGVPYPQENYMQFTGLKDKNGKEIYEGDIIKSTTELAYSNYLVEWRNDRARFGASASLWNDNIMDETDTYEIIGNIYENPELLKESQDDQT